LVCTELWCHTPSTRLIMIFVPMRDGEGTSVSAGVGAFSVRSGRPSARADAHASIRCV
jgi:hypothetical protein